MDSVQVVGDGMKIEDIITKGPNGIDFISGGSGIAGLTNLGRDYINYLIDLMKMKKSEIKATPNMTLGEIQYICGRYFDKKCEGCPALFPELESMLK